MTTPAPLAPTPDADAAGTTASATGKPAQEPMKVTGAEIRATLVLLGFFVVTILLSVLLAQPALDSGLQQFDDPEEPANVIVYVLLILAFTFLILWIAKRGWKWAIRLLILLAVGSSIIFVVYPLLYQTGGIDAEVSMGIALVASAAVTVALWKHPEWYVIDTAGLIVAAGAASVFGISFVPWLVVLLLVLLAVYDAIAVYKTKHMLSLADTVIELRLPVLLVIPKHGGYHFKEDASRLKGATQTNKTEREAMFMGLGDLVMPTILVVSALIFLPNASWAPYPLHAEFGTVEIEGDLDFRFEATATDDGMDPTVQYHILSDDPASSGWAWQLDHDQDADYDESGQGLPATRSRSYDALQAIEARALVTAPDGRNGTATLGVAIDDSDAWHQPLRALWYHPPALGAAIGTLLGYGVLMLFVLRGNPQAGLPLLNGGAIAGFLVGVYAATGSLVFW